MTRFAYDKQFENLIKKDLKRKTRGMVLLGFALVLMIVGLFLIATTDDSLLPYWLMAMVAVVLLLTSEYFGIKKYGIILSNLEKSYLELHSGYVCGYTCSNINSLNSSCYFEVPYDDIRDIRVEGANRLCIDHKNGTYILFIENNQYAVIEVKKVMIEQLKSKQK
ncbi:MAG: hypothetical protein IKM39_05505 [Clostridia bacterium]|nr:hypothetical protein [Clostridia bacterium]